MAWYDVIARAVTSAGSN